MNLTDKQFALLCELFHELPDSFAALPDSLLSAYYDRLYNKAR